MSKSPVTTIDYDKLLESWSITENELKNYIESLTDDIIKNIETVLFSKVINSVRKSGRLAEYDENIYEYYLYLVNYYKRCIKIYEKNSKDVNSDDIKKIADGLYSIIKSKIAQFEDVEKMIEVDSIKGMNPIKAEKVKIIKRDVNLLFKNIINIRKNIKSEIDTYKYDCFNIDMDENSLSLFENVKLCLLSHKDELYSMYLDSLNKCILDINDLVSRDITYFYYELLKDEKNDLGSIIKIQADALEKSIQTTEEENIIQEILKNLREGYQHISKQVDELDINLKDNFISLDDIKDKNEDEFYNEFVLKLKECIKNNAVKNINDKTQPFITLLKDNFIKYTLSERQNYAKQTAEMQIKTEVSFADMICDCFSIIIKHTNENRHNLKDSEFIEIIEGIYETINIKIDNIKESTEIFKNECETETDNIIQNDNYEIKLNMEQINEGLLIWIKLHCDKEAFLSEFHIILDKNKTDDYKCGEFEEIRKKAVQFRKEQLLFEISTFEEILNYSVSRLRKSENTHIVSYVNAVDETTHKIYETLNKFNIEIIKPSAHDMFNGKEHDVLMAEKSKEFKKGEIIKLMNSGYKQGDIILLRANVIAAR